MLFYWDKIPLELKDNILNNLNSHQEQMDKYRKEISQQLFWEDKVKELNDLLIAEAYICDFLYQIGLPVDFNGEKYILGKDINDYIDNFMRGVG